MLSHPFLSFVFQNMGTIEVLHFFLLLFFFFFISTIHAEECLISTCGHGNKSIPIRFPFQLQGHQPQHCGYPGFDLTCNSQSMTVLNLPYSGEFYVREINYDTQDILLYDPENCLPRRLLSFNLSWTPFASAFYQNYTFLSCSPSFTKSRFTSIDCLSNSTSSVLATSSSSLANAMSSSCQIISTLEIPVSGPVQYDEGFSTTLDKDIRLAWFLPDCSMCETQGGMCGFRSNTSSEIDCYYGPGKGNSDGLQVFRIICLSIAVPAITCAVGIACFACFVDRNRYGNRQLGSNVVAAAPEPAIVVMGLNETTIESYQKVILGESRRLPGPNDITCHICLAEYCSKEILRCIPDCKHCFHAHCIDQWLRLNGTCPICRNSPSLARLDMDTT